MSNKKEQPAEQSRDSETTLKDEWAIRPCSVYKDEYDDCKSIKARFHQYFIHGQSIDCTQWKTDYVNCERYRNSNGNDVSAGAAVIRSEEERRQKRLQAHYANTTWKKRTQPPADWSKPLPEWLAKKNENTYLEIKQMEMDGKKSAEETEKSYCTIM